MRCGEHVRCIELYNVERETGTEREIFTVTLHLVFVEISGSEEELLVVVVFGADRNGDFAQLFFESAGSIVELFEYA